MNIWGKVHGVKVYPSGGVIYQAVRRDQTVGAVQAAKLLAQGQPAVIDMGDLRTLSIACEAMFEARKMGLKER